MHSFEELYNTFEKVFSEHHFPNNPSTLYEPCSYLLHLGGKRIRPVICLMSHELFAPLNQNALNTAIAIELFHNFTLMHDDIMDKAPLRRGKQTVHEKYNTPTAILSGDVMSIFSYVHLNKIETGYIHVVLDLFNRTAIQICEGQQIDMDFEQRAYVSLDEYIQMITLKTSVLIGASIQLGAILGGASDGCAKLLFEFGKTLGIAFQLKDDYLDCYGSEKNIGKQIGGDILSNKKSYQMAKAFECANEEDKQQLSTLLTSNDKDKVANTLAFYQKFQIKEKLEADMEKYSQKAFELLEEVPVLSKRKIHFHTLTTTLLNRVQ